MGARLKILTAIAVALLLVIMTTLLYFKPYNTQLPKERVAAVSLEYANGTVSEANVYLAENLTQQETGLMYVKSMGNCNGVNDCYGMLFLFSNYSERCFWMDNTPMPLKQFWMTGNVITFVYAATPYSTNTICHPGNRVLEADINSSLSVGDKVFTT